MELLNAIILGLVQGVTEFLPIASSGHLVLVENWLQIDATNRLAIDAFVYLATALAAMLYFSSDILTLIQALLRKLSRLPVNSKDLTLLYAVFLGSVPAVILGVLLEPLLVRSFGRLDLMALMLALSCLFLMYGEWRYYLQPAHETITPRKGLAIGFFQILSLLPGFSRAGVTIAGGMLLGLTRYEAARFSFILAIPITLGIGSKKLIDLLQNNEQVNWTLVLVGASLAFVAALVVIRIFLDLMQRSTLWPFIWYNVILTALVSYVAFIA